MQSAVMLSQVSRRKAELISTDTHGLVKPQQSENKKTVLLSLGTATESPVGSHDTSREPHSFHSAALGKTLRRASETSGAVIHELNGCQKRHIEDKEIAEEICTSLFLWQDCKIGLENREEPSHCLEREKGAKDFSCTSTDQYLYPLNTKNQKLHKMEQSHFTGEDNLTAYT